MKSLNTVSLASKALVFFSLFVGLASALSKSVYAKSAAGKIELVKGQVFIVDSKDKKVLADPEGKRGRSTQKGAEFFEGETIQTHTGARVKLRFFEGNNEVVLGPSTSLLIARSKGLQASGTSLELSNGTVRSIVNKKYSGEGEDVFEVKTPNSVAGVRGTVFSVRFDAKTLKSQIITERGKVAVTDLVSKRPAVMVVPGTFSEVRAENAPTPAADFKDNGEVKGIIQDLKMSENDSSASADAKNAPASGAAASAPPVALAPEPAKTGDRAPASSEGSGSKEPAKIVVSPREEASKNPIAEKLPYDIVKEKTEDVRRLQEKELAQKQLLDNGLSQIRIKLENPAGTNP